MPAPLSRHLLPLDTVEERLRRQIDDHYHLEMIAENSSQIVEYQEDVLRSQRETAIANLEVLTEIARRQDEASGVLNIVADGLDSLNDTATEILQETSMQTEVIRLGFETIAAEMMEHQRMLREIAEVLRRPYEAKALELLREADCALTNGMKATGRDQREEFNDAARLLQLVLENPIGGRNYVAWFQTGWLRWKYSNNLPDAEESFYHAARLSAPHEDLYHSNSLRHLAYMQYLQCKYCEAYETIQRALSVAADDHDILYDVARYAARTRRDAEALTMLDKCIRLRPHTIITMLTDQDFVS